MSFSYVTSGMFVTVLTVKLENGSTTKEIVAQRHRRQLESARSEIRGLVDHAARHVLTVRSGVAAVEGADGVVANALPAPRWCASATTSTTQSFASMNTIARPQAALVGRICLTARPNGG